MKVQMPGFKNAVRKNLLIPLSLYERSEEISTRVGLTYGNYIRNLIAEDVKRQFIPPRPELIDPKGSEHDQSLRDSFISSKNRLKLINIMHQIRELL